MLDYGGDPGESVIQNHLGGAMAAGTKQKGAKMTRVIGEEAVTVTGLRLQSRGQLLQGGQVQSAFSLAIPHVSSWEPEGRWEGELKNHYPHKTSNTSGVQEHLSSVVGPSWVGSSEG